MHCCNFSVAMELRRRRARRVLMKKYTVAVTQQFYRDKHMVLHAHNQADLEERIEQMTQAEGRRINADDSEVVDIVIVAEQTVL